MNSPMPPVEDAFRGARGDIVPEFRSASLGGAGELDNYHRGLF